MLDIITIEDPVPVKESNEENTKRVPMVDEILKMDLFNENKKRKESSEHGKAKRKRINS